MAVFPFIKTTDGVIKPAIQARLGYKKTHKVTPFIFSLIDSGADYSYCSYSIASYLGFRYNPHKEINSTAANNKSFKSVKGVFIIHVAGKMFESPILVTKVLPPFPQVILGIRGLFDQFRVCLDVKNNAIEII